MFWLLLWETYRNMKLIVCIMSIRRCGLGWVWWTSRLAYLGHVTFGGVATCKAGGRYGCPDCKSPPAHAERSGKHMAPEGLNVTRSGPDRFLSRAKFRGLSSPIWFVHESLSARVHGCPPSCTFIRDNSAFGAWSRLPMTLKRRRWRPKSPPPGYVRYESREGMGGPPIPANPISPILSRSDKTRHPAM